MNCKNCKKQGCSLSGRNHEMSFECKAYVGKTNADRIRSMTDEELAFYIVNHPKWTDESACVNWLKEEAKE